MNDVKGWIQSVEDANVIDVRPSDDSPKPRVVLYGPYNAGKTSLIKRLMTEWGSSSLGLDVGSTPTTFAASEHEGPVILVDTPGTGNVQPLHAERAELEAVDSDILLISTASQLLSGSGEALWRLLLGDAWGVTDLGLDNAWLRFVVGRFDEAGADPVNDPDGYRALAGMKRRELLETISSRGSDSTGVTAHIVAADPGGLVESDVPESMAEYQAGAWDGISGLVADLEQCVAQLPQLRIRRSARVTARDLHRQGRVLQDVLDSAELEAARLRKELAEVRGFRSQLDRSVSRSIVDLEERMERVVGSNVAEIKAAGQLGSFRTRVMADIDLWGDGFAAELRVLVADAPASLTVEAALPKVSAVAPEDVDIARASHGSMDWVIALNENFGEVEKVAKACRGLFKEGDKLTKLDAALSPEAIEVVNQIAGLVVAFKGTSSLSTEEAEQLTRLRRGLREAAQEAGKQSVGPFTAWKDKVLMVLHSSISLMEQMLSDAEQGVEAAKAGVMQIRELLSSYPVASPRKNVAPER